MKYFVTGATGFIGRGVVRQLVAQGHEVITVSRTPSKSDHLFDLGVEIRKGDITEKESMREAMRDVDGVFHLAAWYAIGSHSQKDKARGEQINVLGTRNVLELMKELHIKKGVYTSSLAVFSDTKGRLSTEATHYRGPFLNAYEQTKWKAHFEVAVPMIEHGLPLVIVMPGVVYGPGDASAVHDTFVAYLNRNLKVSPQKTAVCWGHIEDTACGHLLAMEKGRKGESYIIAGPIHTLIETMAIAAKLTGIPAPTRHPSPRMMRFMAAVTEIAGHIMKVPPLYAAENLRSLAGTTYIASSDKAKIELEFAPRPLEEGLRETLAFEMKLLEAEKAR